MFNKLTLQFTFYYFNIGYNIEFCDMDVPMHGRVKSCKTGFFFFSLQNLHHAVVVSMVHLKICASK